MTVTPIRKAIEERTEMLIILQEKLLQHEADTNEFNALTIIIEIVTKAKDKNRLR